MLRSFDYAASSYLLENGAGGGSGGGNREKYTEFWYREVSTAFLESYRKETDGSPFIPTSSRDFNLLLNTFILEKAVYELMYELNHRPAWTAIPLRALSLLFPG